MEQRSGPVIGLVRLDAVLSFRHRVAGLGDLGRDAEGSACEFLIYVTKQSINQSIYIGPRL
jgi:hypothetical protein